MTWVSQRSLSLGLALLMSALIALSPLPAVAAPLSATDPVFGAATGAMDAEGDMAPTGNGRFTIDDRVYSGKMLGRSVGSLAAACFTGDLRSVEEWALEAPRMVGTHESDVTIRSERGVLTLRLRGQMEQFSASGTWTIVRASGGCSPLDGDGKYTATYATSGARPDFRLTFDGESQS
jgi:hypothetical protein